MPVVVCDHRTSLDPGVEASDRVWTSVHIFAIAEFTVAEFAVLGSIKAQVSLRLFPPSSMSQHSLQLIHIVTPMRTYYTSIPFS
jgi:hypothetical protein